MMPDTPDANPFLGAFKHRRKLGFTVFFGVLVACAAAGFVTLQYSASAVVALNPQANTNAGGQSRSSAEIAWSSLPDKQIEALIEQLNVNSGITRMLAQGQILTYVRSRISFHEMATADNAPKELLVSYRGSDRSTVINLANALAQSLAGVKVPGPQTAATAGSNTTIADELAQSRTELQLLSAGGNTNALKAELQKHFRTDKDLKEQEQDIEFKLSELAQQLKQEELAAAKARMQPAPPPPPNPVRISLQRQISETENRLAQLRQRYTEEYPDVIEERNALAALVAKLNSLPPDKPQPRPSLKTTVSPMEEERVAAQEAALQDSETEVQNKIQENERQAEAVRQRIADGKNFAADYALEQAHYNALLKAQQAGAVTVRGDVPLFMIVDSATAAKAEGIGFEPIFWILSLLGAGLAAFIVAYTAEQINPMMDEPSAAEKLHRY